PPACTTCRPRHPWEAAAGLRRTVGTPRCTVSGVTTASVSTTEPHGCAPEKISGDLEALNALWREVALAEDDDRVRLTSARASGTRFGRTARRSPRPCDAPPLF